MIHQDMTLLRVQRLVPHEDGKHMKFKETFVAVPNTLYEQSLKEKKACKTLDFYCFKFKWGTLHYHSELVDYIQRIVGRIDEASIERINIYSQTHLSV